MWLLADLAKAIDAEQLGEGNPEITGVATLEKAEGCHLSFLANPRYRPQLANTRAGAVIVSDADRNGTQVARLVVRNPYASYALAAQLLHPEKRPTPGIHPTAVIDPSAYVPADCSIGPYTTVGAHTRLAPAVVLGAGVRIGNEVTVGAGTRLHDGVIIYDACSIGQRCILHSGVVIGADGFGMAWSGSAWIKIPQIGKVIIENDVEVGANTTIDRGALDDTVIEEGVKLDNLIQIAHNVRIGAHTVIAGCTGISGSTHIGKNCRIGGGVGIVGHVDICDGTTISGFSLITKSITEPGVYTSSIPSQPHRTWMNTLAALRNLPELSKSIHALKRQHNDTTTEDESS